MTMLTTTLLKNLRGHRLYIDDIGGRMWAATPYWMVPVDASIEHLLSDYNLKPERMACEVYGTVKRMDTDKVPNLDDLLTKVTGDHGPALTRYTIGDLAVTLTSGGDSRKRELWVSSNHKVRVVVDTAYRSTLEALAGGVDRWLGAKKDARTKPVIAERDGAVVGVVMPVRVDSVETAVLLDDAA